MLKVLFSHALNNRQVVSLTLTAWRFYLLF